MANWRTYLIYILIEDLHLHRGVKTFPPARQLAQVKSVKLEEVLFSYM